MDSTKMPLLARILRTRLGPHSKAFHASTVFSRLDVHDEGSRANLQWSSWPRSLRFSYTWLRDHCRCPLCYNTKTFQRIHGCQAIALNIRPVLVKPTDKGLHIEWQDGHVSHYDHQFLWQSSYEGRKSSRKLGRVLWNKHSFPEIKEISVPYSAFQTTNGKSSLIRNILTYGFGIVDEVPPKIEDSKEAIETLFVIQNTFFDQFWAFDDKLLQHSDTAYTNIYLGPHTDCTYLTESPRLQIFHCLKAAEEGGETLLVDGFSIAEQFRKVSPGGYKFLSSFAIPSEYIEEGQHMMTSDVVFKHCPVTKEIRQFRFNAYDRAPLSSLPYEQVDEYYSHLKGLDSLMSLPKNESWLKLNPGQILFLDNWRVMHGRAAYKGSRTMCGCYIDNSHFTSKARSLGFNVHV